MPLSIGRLPGCLSLLVAAGLFVVGCASGGKSAVSVDTGDADFAADAQPEPELSELAPADLSESSDSQAPSDLSESSDSQAPSDLSESSDSQAPSDLSDMSDMSDMSASSDSQAPSDLSDCPFVSCGAGCCLEGQVCHNALCCTPACEGKACGDDGCGGSCGECPAGYACGPDASCACVFAGCGANCCGGGQVCTPTGCCSPDCQGKECGESGCGTQCGTCTANEQCSPLNTCVCSFAECGEDCCGESQPCIDGSCCVPSCKGKKCGDDGCGGSCGTCGPNSTCAANQKSCPCTGTACKGACCADTEICHDGKCCQPICQEGGCGDDGCGGSCGTCEAGCYCGGGLCLGSCGPCVPDCTNNQCGWDGCGGKCGTCTGNTFCEAETWLCKPGKCQYPTKYTGESVKINYLKSGLSGYDGQAVDVDNDPATCAPKTMCDGGRDNEFAGLMKSLAPALGGSEPLLASLEAGEIIMLIELNEAKTDGTPFLANLYRGKPVLPKTTCNFQTQTCDYTIELKSFVPETCLPVTAFDNAQIGGDKFTAGGPGYKFDFPFILAMTGGQEVTLPATWAKIVADLEFDAAGTITSMKGVIGCAVPKTALMDMIMGIPEEAFPVDKDLVVMLMDLVVKPDIDTDGDGVQESVSTGLVFSAIPGKITGLSQP